MSRFAEDPREAVLTFVRILPRTIRGEMLTFIALYGLARDMPGDADACEADLHAYLMVDGMSAVARIISIVAVIDFSLSAAFARTLEAEPVLARLAEEESTAFRETYLSLPLRRRHWEQALASWRALRAGELSTGALRRFEERQLGLTELDRPLAV